MANIKNITKKLVNNGYSEDKLMVMTEKEIREAYKLLKEESTMKNNTNTTTNNSTTAAKEDTTMTKEMIKVLDTHNRLEQLILILDWCRIGNVHDDFYVKKDVLAKFLFDKDIIARQLSKNELKKTKREELVSILADAVNNLTKNTKKDTVDVGDFCQDNTPENIEEHVVQTNNSDAKAKTVEVLKLIKSASADNHKKGFGTTVSAYMLCAYILQAGYGIKKLKGHENEITDEQKDTVKKVRQWLIDKGYIKACVYKTNSKSVYTDDYDGTRAASMVHYTKSQGLTCVGVSSYKVCF